jgi:hypothetical protein
MNDIEAKKKKEEVEGGYNEEEGGSCKEKVRTW